jgi:hypothetical protein
MTTTLKINSYSDINPEYIKNLLQAMFSSFGEIEVIIKPTKKDINFDISQRIQNVENGEELLYFTDDEFDELNTNLLKGIKPDLSKIKRIKKNEKIPIVSKSGF